MSSWTPNEVEVLTQAHKVVPSIAAATSKPDKLLLIKEMQQFAVDHGLSSCAAYPMMFAAALHWMTKAVDSVADAREVPRDQVLQEMALAAASRQANAV